MAKLKIKTPGILAFDVKLAVALKDAGVNNHDRVAIFIHQLQFYLNIKSKSDKYKMILVDGNEVKHTFMSYREWALVFPTWSMSTIIRTIKIAEDSGIVGHVLKGRGQKARSKWYRINKDMLMSHLQDVETTHDGYSSSDDVQDVETSQNDYPQKPTSQSDQLNPSRTSQSDQLAQTITELPITELLFNGKKNKGEDTPMGKGNYTPALDISKSTVTEITPKNIASVKEKCPNITDQQIKDAWDGQEGYWRTSNLTNYQLEGKVIARIKEQKGKKKIGMLRQGKVSFHGKQKVFKQK